MAVAPGTVLGVPTGYTITAQVPAPPRLGQPYGLRPRNKARKSRGGKKRTSKHVSKRRTHRSRRSHRRKSHRRRTHRRR